MLVLRARGLQWLGRERPPSRHREADLEGKNASFTTPAEFAEHIATADKAVSF
jgi:hypothetical protein